MLGQTQAPGNIIIYHCVLLNQLHVFIGTCPLQIHISHSEVQCWLTVMAISHAGLNLLRNCSIYSCSLQACITCTGIELEWVLNESSLKDKKQCQ